MNPAEKLLGQILALLRASAPCCSCCDGDEEYRDMVLRPIQKMVDEYMKGEN